VRCIPRASSLRDGPATARPRSALVVSHHLDGSLDTPTAGLLHPAASWGSSRFFRVRAGDWPDREAAPRDAVRTLRRVGPRQQPRRITAPLCPPDLTVSGGLRGVAPLSSPIVSRPVAEPDIPDPSMGFGPLQGASSTAAVWSALAARAEARRPKAQTIPPWVGADASLTGIRARLGHDGPEVLVRAASEAERRRPGD